MTILLMRGLAFLIDLQIIGIVGFLCGKLFGINLEDKIGVMQSGLMGVGTVFVYFSIIESSLFKGRSIGKVLLKLHVIKTTFAMKSILNSEEASQLKLENPSLVQAMIRSFFKVLPLLILWFRMPFKGIPILNINLGEVFELASLALVISYVYQIVTTKTFQSPYDIITKTRVIRIEPLIDLKPRKSEVDEISK